MGTDSLDLLLRSRLIIARLGESDVMRWWRTDGILGPDGAYVGPRVLPKTHPTGRARIAFAVARHACDERYPDKDVHHLFRVDPETEDRFDALLVEKLEDSDFWNDMMKRVEAIVGEVDCSEVLIDAGVVTEDDLVAVRSVGLGPEGQSVEVKRGDAKEEMIRRLAAGFVHSRSGSLAVPYIRNGK